ncbi:hypothetical protein [Nonomuraea lactucae]|uniref:hypothetical protein n=1 Tax=Nonomuraea lactucae TaxID=2249762 RepID=UPI0013B45132|nr:hypothetical protein [Nonomuraea lactucae]
MNQAAQGGSNPQYSRIDDHKVGVTFIDVLFALVVGRMMESATDAEQLPSSAVAHLILAATVTLLSWVGYHNSVYRPQYEIKVFNYPFWQFVIDVLLVGLYWLMATTAEYKPQGDPWNGPHSAEPEALTVFAIFALYVIWDEIGRRISNNPAYKDDTDTPDRIRRRHVTWFFAIAVMGSLIVVLLMRPKTETAIILTDVALVVIVILYRVAKDWPKAKPSWLRRT